MKRLLSVGSTSLIAHWSPAARGASVMLSGNVHPLSLSMAALNSSVGAGPMLRTWNANVPSDTGAYVTRMFARATRFARRTARKAAATDRAEKNADTQTVGPSAISHVAVDAIHPMISPAHSMVSTVGGI